MGRLYIAALLMLIVDQASKYGVLYGLDLPARGIIEVWPPYLNFHMAWNRGMNFGLLASHAELTRWLLITVAVGISAWVWYWMRSTVQSNLARISAGLLIGGAIGNVLDRIVFGAVVDFLNMSCCGINNPYAFNIADIGVFAGAIGLVLFVRDGAGSARKGS